MPGNHLSDIEKKLQRAWSAGAFGEFPLLKSIAISAPIGKGLRGIKNISVDFAYPVTFLSGQNGSGKSTILSLAALAFHGVPGHAPFNCKRWTGEGASQLGYYTFQDFFYRGPGDPDVSGVQITWEFSKGKAVSIAKQSDKWMRYERRPARPVEFLGLTRAVPAIELPALRKQFGVAASMKPKPLGESALAHLQKVLGKVYPRAEVLNGARGSIRRSGRADGYTSFNMGTGEDALISLLARLESVPPGSLVIIEELETGLHPAAQRRAATALIEICWERKLQIIGSTHSHHVLDALPRESRLLVIPEGAEHRVVSAPSTRYALSEISEVAQSELLVLCEDDFAVRLLSQALPKNIRKRVDVRSCGAKSELALQARTYLHLAQQARCLILWDGDVSEAEATGYLRQAAVRIPGASIDSRLSFNMLPGQVAPERWALESAKTHGEANVKNRFKFESEAQASEMLNRCGLGDPHSITYELGQQSGLPSETAEIYLLECVVESSPEIPALVEKIELALSGVNE
jgi:energy-coupling factor transporter ATP-binding protein EcfA2